MAETQKYKLVYAPEVKEHLKAIDKQHHALEVLILTIGVKEKNELIIGKERIKL